MYKINNSIALENIKINRYKIVKQTIRERSYSNFKGINYYFTYQIKYEINLNRSFFKVFLLTQKLNKYIIQQLPNLDLAGTGIDKKDCELCRDNNKMGDLERQALTCRVPATASRPHVAQISVVGCRPQFAGSRSLPTLLIIPQ